MNFAIITGKMATQFQISQVMNIGRIENNRPMWNMLMNLHRQEGVTPGVVENERRTRVWDAGLIQSALRNMELYIPTTVNGYLISIGVKPTRSLTARLSYKARALCISNGLFIEKSGSNVYPFGMLAAIYEVLDC